VAGWDASGAGWKASGAGWDASLSGAAGPDVDPTAGAAVSPDESESEQLAMVTMVSAHMATMDGLIIFMGGSPF
jgi:hypothetical protein